MSKDFNCSSQIISCIGLLGVIALCCSIIYVFIAKPSLLWNPVVEFFNAGVQYPAYNYSNQSSEEAEAEVLSQISVVGENSVEISESQLTSILRPKFPQIKDLVFDIEESKVLLYTKLDDSSNPIFGILEFKIQNDGKAQIQKIGTPRFYLPEFMNGFTNKFFNTIIDLGNGKSGDNTNIVDSIITQNENLTIKEVTVQKDKINIKLNVSVNLFKND